MKCILTICLLASLCGCAAPEKTPPPVIRAKREPQLAARSQVGVAVLDAAVESLNDGRAVPGARPCETQAEAQLLIRGNLHLIRGPNRSPFAEHKGYFLFAGLTTEEPDDGSFRSGYAVKKGTAKIYFWHRK